MAQQGLELWALQLQVLAIRVGTVWVQGKGIRSLSCGLSFLNMEPSIFKVRPDWQAMEVQGFSRFCYRSLDVRRRWVAFGRCVTDRGGGGESL